MEMGFTWTFPENEIKKQFFHLFFNFCKIMIVKILTIKIFHRPVEKQQNVIVNLFTMKFYCFSTSLWKNLFHRLAEKPFPPAYKYISSSLQAGKSISTQRWKRRNATWKKLKIDEKDVEHIGKYVYPGIWCLCFFAPRITRTPRLTCYLK